MEWKTGNSYASPDYSVYSPQTVYHWIELGQTYMLVSIVQESESQCLSYAHRQASAPMIW